VDATRVIDTLLDRSVVLGYGSLGLVARRRLPGWPADPPRIDGTVVLVTGAGSGIGQAACVGFARLGASVRALGRDERRAEQAAAQVRRSVRGADVRPVACDVSSLAAVRAFAERFAAAESRLDVLVNNAGVMPEERTRSADGHELMFATHVLAPFALIALLRGMLAVSAPSRVINVSSGGMYSQRIPGDDLQSAHGDYSPSKVYARTKREEVAISDMWARRLAGTGIAVVSMHPGWADTEGLQREMPVFRSITRTIMRTPAQGADTIVWLGAAPEAVGDGGGFWHDRRRRPSHYLIGPPADSARDRQRLWDTCRSLVEQAGIAVGE
jgi:NAD(P)-dependent dehydrogenase (short-subunit alcohol dehydrogenase family)